MTPSASTSDAGDLDGSNGPPTEPLVNQPEDPVSQETHWPARPWLVPPHLTLWPLDVNTRPLNSFVPVSFLLETNGLLQPSFLPDCLAFSSDTCALLLAGVEMKAWDGSRRVVSCRQCILSLSCVDVGEILPAVRLISFPLTLALLVSFFPHYWCLCKCRKCNLERLEVRLLLKCFLLLHSALTCLEDFPRYVGLTFWGQSDFSSLF